MIRKTLGLTTISALVLAASCSDSRIGDYIAPATVPGFEIPDSGADVVVEAELTSYCPSNKTVSRPARPRASLATST